MSRSYHPYPFFQRRRDTLPRPDNGGDPQIVAHHHTLTELNVVQGKLCTFIHDNESWEEVPRPQRVVGRGLYRKDIAASGLHKVWAPYASPFFCPHRRRSGLTYDPLVLRLNGIHQGGSADFYRAVDHQCDFKIVIPPVTETHILRTWQDREDFDRLKRGDQDDDDEDSQGLASSQGTPSSAICSFSSQDTTASLSSFMDPILPASSQTSASSSTRANLEPRTNSVPVAFHKLLTRLVTPTPRSGSPSLQSFYSTEVAEARKHSDVDALKYLDEITDEGLLERDPSVHPVWNYDIVTPPVLRVYDMHVYGSLHNRRLQHLQFVGKPTGQVIRDMTQALGVPFCDYAALVRSTQRCDCCLAYFSPDGYNDHRREGKCSNHPALLPIPSAEPFKEEFKFRSFRDGQRPQWIGDTIHTPVGAALLEWNSRLGIPCDVWLTVASAMVLCAGCDLVRTIPAHRLHMDGKRTCTDPGQHIGLVPVHGQD
ncbi:hypothetical protein K438DRAFT_2008852 [Mycena galopus ATCC 62051]|nr:hypothetical protein K438DRAFT_2008852 [Mycena galopus ATCC 62051]